MRGKSRDRTGRQQTGRRRGEEAETGRGSGKERSRGGMKAKRQREAMCQGCSGQGGKEVGKCEAVESREAKRHGGRGTGRQGGKDTSGKEAGKWESVPGSGQADRRQVQAAVGRWRGRTAER